MGYFCVHFLNGFQDKRVLRTCGGILVISHYEPENLCQEQTFHNYDHLLLDKETLFLCSIFFCGEEFVEILWFYVPCVLFSGQISYAIYLVVLTLGVSVMLFSSGLSKSSEICSLS